MTIINFTNFAFGETGNWIANIIEWLVNGTSVAVGIILFTLILKAITLPFDVMSRVSMRKNSLKMEEMRPELEKLQKQYADDKMLYNQKMQALYKKNGYSMWGACLPTILTLVIFIIAINGFTTYANYKNREDFYEMSLAYNNVIYKGFEIDGEYLSINEKDGSLVVDDAAVKDAIGEQDSAIITSGNVTIYLEKTETAVNSEIFTTIHLYTENGYIKYSRTYKSSNGTLTPTGEPSYTVIEDKLDSNNLKLTVNGVEKSFSETSLSANDFVKNICRAKAAEKYRETKATFLWVKSIWATDSPFAHPVSANNQTINQRASCDCNQTTITYLNEENYAELTTDLEEEKAAPNGYFILVVLTALSSLLMQLITTKSQKAQMELQTVDGQGAQTQKMMTWMMPIMMAFFAFLYSAAFSIYIILSSLISVLVTLVTNYFVGKKFDKIKAQKAAAPVRGRIYVKKEEPKEEPKKKKEESTKVDFLNSTKENRRIRKGK